ncbi:MAG TPA: malto-oligosyltrehalose trehalohydrolase [Opitutaceae bacterium]|nr:malto-oligosyltrehalose trehalohydrolase [Opitutaceae bacterium]
MPARTYPIGAELGPAGGASFRVWAPAAAQVTVELLDDNGQPAESVALAAEPDGYFSGFTLHARAGTLYRYRLPKGAYPDPASRRQPQGPHGPSEIVDPAFPWTDQQWQGRPRDELVIYELHLGTYTPEGTWRAATGQLDELARLGITAVEIMPVAEFPGAFGWGYDGVDLFAPYHRYGTPAEARAFVNRAHELGVMVILDVVYNHLGPDGCYLQEFSPDYFTTRYTCEWGQPLNFDGDRAGPVREFFVTNARYWIEEFHFDGLRLDATQQIYDASPDHILAEIADAVHAAAPHRRTFVVGENEPQLARLVRPRAQGGYGLDGLWNDDFHHAAIVASTGKSEAYYSDYRGTPQELISACKYGFLFQGQWYRWQRQRRGAPAFDVPAAAFVTFLQNHDQVANSLRGARLHQLTSPGGFRAVTALLLLAPTIPLLFQGQEFAATAPFLYFADHNAELTPRVGEGRRNFLRQFRTIAADDAADTPPPPGDPATFRRCRLDLDERARHAPAYRLHEDLLRLRRTDHTIRHAARIDGAVLETNAFVLRFFGADGDDRLLVVNLGPDLRLGAASEPLLAPPAEHGWTIAWSSESPAYGGGGTPPLETTTGWIIGGPAAYLLQPTSDREIPDAKISEKD